MASPTNSDGFEHKAETTANGGNAGKFPNNNGKPCTGQPASGQATSSVNKKNGCKQKKTKESGRKTAQLCERPCGPLVKSSEEFAHLLTEHYAALLGYARWTCTSDCYVRSHHITGFTAEDVFNDVVLKCCRHWRLIPQEPGSFCGYMKKCIHNRFLELWKRMKHRESIIQIYSFEDEDIAA